MLCSAFTCKAKSWDQGLVHPPPPAPPAQPPVHFSRHGKILWGSFCSLVFPYHKWKIRGFIHSWCKCSRGIAVELACWGQEGRSTQVWVVSPALSGGRLCWLLWGWKELWAAAAWVCVLRGACASSAWARARAAAALSLAHTAAGGSCLCTCLGNKLQFLIPASKIAPGRHKSEAKASFGWAVDRLWVPGRLCHWDRFGVKAGAFSGCDTCFRSWLQEGWTKGEMLGRGKNQPSKI